jgi:hypothetical protein
MPKIVISFLCTTYEELRLQNLETINKQKLKEFALRFNKTGIVVLADMLIGFIESEIKASKTL